MKIKFIGKKKKAKTLSDCPVGLFITYSGDEPILCMKTEYGNNSGGIDAYIVSTGERLSCEEQTGTRKGCDNILVYPIKIKNKDVF